MDMSRIKAIKKSVTWAFERFFDRFQRYRDTGLGGRYGVIFQSGGGSGKVDTSAAYI
jgi:hypothetical protein